VEICRVFAKNTVPKNIATIAMMMVIDNMAEVQKMMDGAGTTPFPFMTGPVGHA
jgi:hypothetical protein